jgi:hypothetical protein
MWPKVDEESFLVAITADLQTTTAATGIRLYLRKSKLSWPKNPLFLP